MTRALTLAGLTEIRRGILRLQNLPQLLYRKVFSESADFRRVWRGKGAASGRRGLCQLRVSRMVVRCLG